MIEKHTIQSTKQDNGLWGTPMYLKNIDGHILFRDKYKNMVFSAILMSFAECQKQNFSLKIRDNGHFVLETHKSYFYKVEDFGLIDNTIYYLPTNDDKLLFNRLLKIKLIKNKI